MNRAAVIVILYRIRSAKLACTALSAKHSAHKMCGAAKHTPRSFPCIFPVRKVILQMRASRFCRTFRYLMFVERIEVKTRCNSGFFSKKESIQLERNIRIGDYVWLLRSGNHCLSELNEPVALFFFCCTLLFFLFTSYTI
jgi:hypothetical protein